MFKTGIINPQINYHLSCLAHQDSVMISDAAMELPAYLNRVDPVSYTHLDVYKRQSLQWELEIPLVLVCSLFRRTLLRQARLWRL